MIVLLSQCHKYVTSLLKVGFKLKFLSEYVSDFTVPMEVSDKFPEL